MRKTKSPSTLFTTTLTTTLSPPRPFRFGQRTYAGLRNGKKKRHLLSRPSLERITEPGSESKMTSCRLWYPHFVGWGPEVDDDKSHHGLLRSLHPSRVSRKPEVRTCSSKDPGSSTHGGPPSQSRTRDVPTKRRECLTRKTNQLTDNISQLGRRLNH